MPLLSHSPALVGISDVKKSSLASSPRALLTQANYLARAETIELAESSFTAEDRESEATFPSTLGTELPLREPFIRIAVTPGQHEQLNDSRTAETGLIPIPGPGPGESFQPALLPSTSAELSPGLTEPLPTTRHKG